MQVSPSLQPAALQEDLLVVTAAGGLVRHKLRLQPKTKADPGPSAGDRYHTMSAISHIKHYAEHQMHTDALGGLYWLERHSIPSMFKILLDR